MISSIESVGGGGGDGGAADRLVDFFGGATSSLRLIVELSSFLAAARARVIRLGGEATAAADIVKSKCVVLSAGEK